MGLKITTWNVNGLRSVLSKGALDWIQKEKSDILCFQEIKTRPDPIIGEQYSGASAGAAIAKIPAQDGFALALEKKPSKSAPVPALKSAYQSTLGGYMSIWNPAERAGYSGVATFTQLEPVSVQLGIDAPVFDIEGRVIVTRYPGFLLFNIYFPSGQRGYERVAYKLDFYAHLLQLCDQLHAVGEKIIICGDFNTAHQPIDLKNPKANQKTSGFLPEERAWIDRYLEHGFIDAYRSIYPDRVQYTWWTYVGGARDRNIGWRLDYFMVSKNLMTEIEDVIVHDDIRGSDHCPVSIVISDGCR